MGNKLKRGGASSASRDKDKEPKEGFLPIAIVGGAMLVCCFALVLLVSGASGIAAWFGGIDPLLAAGIAVAFGAVFVLFRRARKSTLTETDGAPTTALKGDR